MLRALHLLNRHFVSFCHDIFNALHAENCTHPRSMVNMLYSHSPTAVHAKCVYDGRAPRPSKTCTACSSRTTARFLQYSAQFLQAITLTRSARFIIFFANDRAPRPSRTCTTCLSRTTARWSRSTPWRRHLMDAVSDSKSTSTTDQSHT